MAVTHLTAEQQRLFSMGSALRYASGGYVPAGKAYIVGDTPGESLISQGMVDATKAGLLKVMPDVVVSVPAGVASAQEAVCVSVASGGFVPMTGHFTVEAADVAFETSLSGLDHRDLIGTIAQGMKDGHAKAAEAARKAEAEQVVAKAVERAIAFR